MKLRHRTKKMMALIIVPLSFLVVGYGMIYILSQPILRPLASIYSLISSEYGPNFDDNMNNLYDGKSEDTNGEIALKDLKLPDYGDQYGEIKIDRVDLKVKLYYGDDLNILDLGAGQYNGSFMPGFNRTIMIAGHTIPYFQKLGDVNVGDEVQISTHYGIYRYRITDTKIGSYTDKTMYDLGQTKKEQLILYTCYPLDGIGFKELRLFVYADKISGPTITGD